MPIARGKTSAFDTERDFELSGKSSYHEIQPSRGFGVKVQDFAFLKKKSGICFALITQHC